MTQILLVVEFGLSIVEVYVGPLVTILQPPPLVVLLA